MSRTPTPLSSVRYILLVALLGLLACPQWARSAAAGKTEKAPASANDKHDEKQAAEGAASKAAATPAADKETAGGKSDRAKQKASQSEKESAEKPETAAPADAVPDKTDGLLLGEFAGPVEVARSRYQPMGLQLRPMGGGAFEAMAFNGGLPGAGARSGSAMTLIGKRSGDFLVLSGGPWAVFVQQDGCALIDASGRKIGTLDRVRRESPTMGAKPPQGAIVLFDGKNTDQFVNGRITDDGLLMEGADIRPMFQDFDMHVEFLLPLLPAQRDQGRGNSGLYLQSRYELQILDSFAQEPQFNGCGSLYRFRAPDVNMCLPPAVWQTYELSFTAPRWAGDGSKLKNARISVWQNGVRIHNNVELADKTGAGQPEAPTLLPIRLQDHRNPVRFRNIWVIDRGATPGVRFPVMPPSKKPATSPERKERAAKPAVPAK